MVSKVEMFACEICKRRYDSISEAMECESQGFGGELILNIGDKINYKVWSRLIDDRVEDYFVEAELIDVHKSHINGYYFRYIDGFTREPKTVNIYGNYKLRKILE